VSEGTKAVTKFTSSWMRYISLVYIIRVYVKFILDLLVLMWQWKSYGMKFYFALKKIKRKRKKLRKKFATIFLAQKSCLKDLRTLLYKIKDH